MLLVPLVMAARDAGPTSSLPTVATPLATTTPKPPATLSIQRVVLPGYHVTEANVMAQGFMFNGWPDDGQPHPIGTLYYYSFATRRVSALDTRRARFQNGHAPRYSLRARERRSGHIPEGRQQSGILGVCRDHASMGRHYARDSADQEGPRRDLPFQGYIATDGRQIVWTVSGSRNGQFITTGINLKTGAALPLDGAQCVRRLFLACWFAPPPSPTSVFLRAPDGSFHSHLPSFPQLRRRRAIIKGASLSEKRLALSRSHPAPMRCRIARASLSRERKGSMVA